MPALLIEDDAFKLGQRAGNVTDKIVSDTAKAQHARTLRWVRERLEAGEHLDDLLAEEPG